MALLHLGSSRDIPELGSFPCLQNRHTSSGHE